MAPYSGASRGGRGFRASLIRNMVFQALPTIISPASPGCAIERRKVEATKTNSAAHHERMLPFKTIAVVKMAAPQKTAFRERLCQILAAYVGSGKLLGLMVKSLAYPTSIRVPFRDSGAKPFLGQQCAKREINSGCAQEVNWYLRYC